MMAKKVQKKPRRATKKPRRKRRPSKVPDWVQSIKVNERKRSITLKMDIAGFLRSIKSDDKILTFVIRPKANAKKGPGPYDYMLELQAGNLVVPGPLGIFLPNEPTHGREFFEKIKGMLRDVGAYGRQKEVGDARRS